MALVWLLFTYSALKLGSIARARNPGFRRTAVRFRDRLLAREPALFLAACLIAVPLALLASSYSHQTLTNQYEHAVTCYGRMMALGDIPGFRTYLNDSAIYERMQAHRQAAFAMARGLEMKPDAVSSALAGKVKFFADQYATLQRRSMRQRGLDQASITRCLLPPGAAAAS